jgi:hypothetical protein
MPLSINVGLSRKASRDFQSTGVSINVTAELDQALLARPDDLQRQIGDLYAQAQQAMEKQAGATDQGQPRQARPRSARAASPPPRNGNGHGGGMTESQRNAIRAIARRANANADYEAQQIIGVALDDLTVRQASELIDHLKSLTSAEQSR